MPCKIDCGGNWGGWYGCTASCRDPNADNAQATIYGTQYRNWENATGPFNGGNICPSRGESSCSTSCLVNCKGGYSGNQCTNCCPSIYGLMKNKICPQYNSFNPYIRPAANGGTCPGTIQSQCSIDCGGNSKSGFTIKVNGTNLGFNAEDGRNWSRAMILYGRDHVPFTIDSAGVIRDQTYPSYYLGYGNAGRLEYTDGKGYSDHKKLFCHMSSNNVGPIYCRSDDNKYKGWLVADRIGSGSKIRLDNNNHDMGTGTVFAY